MLVFIELFLNRILFSYIVMKTYSKEKFYQNPSILQLVTLCIYIPFQEEIMFRYALYNFLEKYVEPGIIPIINGIAFGLIHYTNSYVIDMTQIQLVASVIFTGHLGYVLTKMNDNLFLCIIIHCIYNLIGILTLKYMHHDSTPKCIIDISGYSYIRFTRGRRANSLGYVKSDDDPGKLIDNDRIDPNVLKSFEHYDNKINSGINKN